MMMIIIIIVIIIIIIIVNVNVVKVGTMLLVQINVKQDKKQTKQNSYVKDSFISIRRCFFCSVLRPFSLWYWNERDLL